ncbi:hypothetical protein [Lactobacillus sp.]|uniref:hypothetical protein n=1 Tax=Lactobacillus sp. TaxID=1591 RepID=UPI0019951FD1|nr:hypothetical protein [Lactobacillus sp.]MBD5430799.1 hypothetical protein [Lactobacillus sp.]
MFGKVKFRKHSKRKVKEKTPKAKKKKQTDFKGTTGFMYPFGYIDTDAYIFLGRKVMAVFDVVFQYGTNRPAGVGWVNRLIPSDYLKSGKVLFIQRQRGVDKTTQDDITRKTMSSSLATMSSSTDGDAKEMAKNSARIEDIRLSAGLAKNDTMIDSDILLIVRANSPKAVEQVIYDLKMDYKNDGIRGVMIVRRTGEQLKSLRESLISVHGDHYHNTDMSTVAAGRLFLPSVGFSDSHGVMVGNDIHSLIRRNTAVIDFSDIKNAVVYMGDVQPFVSIGGYEGGSFMQNGGTAIAHVIADGNYLNGGRTHHIVLSQNDYRTTDSLVFDMREEAINPFEVFGSPETVEQDANANFDKVTTMLLMAAGAENNDYIKQHLKSELRNWFIYKAKGNGIYTDDPEHEPLKAQRILATENHDDYPTPHDFLLNMHNMVASASNSSPDERRDAKLMYETLQTLVTSYPSIFRKTTTLPNVFKAKDRNIYYDLSHLGEDPMLTSITFLNVLAYVTHRALPGETIVVEGLDNVKLPIESLIPYKERMTSKGINLISVFEHIKNPVNPISYENFSGRLSQQDMIVLGGITEEDAQNFSSSWQQALPQTVATQLIQANDGILYFYRRRDHIGALIDTHLIL